MTSAAIVVDGEATERAHVGPDPMYVAPSFGPGGGPQTWLEKKQRADEITWIVPEQAAAPWTVRALVWFDAEGKLERRFTLSTVIMLGPGEVLSVIEQG